ncbi:MAG: hypothetical protein HY878_07070 [Deltaproteobacteria bacterium]|nr:hypothetical protein [Deltaproteobacteria bacterium]
MKDLLNCIPTIKGGLVIREENEGYLLYNPDTDQLHSISDDAYSFLQLLDGTRNVESAIHTFTQNLDEKEAGLAKWLTLLLVKDFMDRQLVAVE